MTNTAPNRYLFQVEGKAADVERVLHVNLNLYKHPTQNPQLHGAGPRADPGAERAGAAHHAAQQFRAALFQGDPARTGRGTQRGGALTGSGPGGMYIGSDFRAAYYGTGAKAKLDGHGQSVGLMELEGYIPSDVPFYFTTVGQPLTVAVNGISVDGTPVDCGHCDDGEQVLDIDYAISMAPGMDQVQVYVGQDPTAIENRMATDNTSKQLSTSWGYDEDFADEDAIYQEMAAQGQSYFTASGDFSTLIDSGPWPEEDANIIAVGGHGSGDNRSRRRLAIGARLGRFRRRSLGRQDDPDRVVPTALYQRPESRLEDAAQRRGRFRQCRFRHVWCSRGHCSGGWAGTSFSRLRSGRVQRADQSARDQEGKADGRFPQSDDLRAGEGQQEDVPRRRRQQERQVPGREGLRPCGRPGPPRGAKTINIVVGK